MLLQDIQILFSETGKDRLQTASLLEKLHEMDDRPWPGWHRGNPITANGVARLLKPFGITPTKWRDYNNTHRGYTQDQFRDAFARYLPDSAATAATSLNSIGEPEFSDATPTTNVAPTDSEKFKPNKDVATVADGSGESSSETRADLDGEDFDEGWI